MNRKILKIYYSTLIIAITCVLIIWGILIYLFIGGKNSDQRRPEYLIHTVGEFISETDSGLVADQKLKNLLQSNGYWLQVISPDGNAVLSENTPGNIPQSYTPSKLINICLASDRLPGYTVYGTEFNSTGSTIILGCRSSLVSKFSISIEKGLRSEWMILLISFVLSLIAVSTAMSLIFMNKISKPVTLLTENIEEIGRNDFHEKNYKGEIFNKVFVDLSDLNTRLHENRHLRNEWISNISHDIKTPLSSIKGYGEILSNPKYELNSNEVISYSSEILKSENQIEELLQDLKVSSSIDEGSYRLNRQETDICSLIKDCVSSMDTGKYKGTQIHLSMPDKLLTSCDQRLMKRCICNILYNAIVHNENPVTIEINVKKDTDRVCIEISDNGKGIPEDKLPMVFERYYSGDSTDKYKGSGLGLAIARDAVRLHGGDISVESVPKKKTTFRIII